MAEQLPWLPPPYQWFNPPEGVPVILPVVRYEIGLSNRPMLDPPYSVVKPTIRFRFPGAGAWGIRPYADFTHRLLIQRVLRLYDDLFDQFPAGPVAKDGPPLERLLQSLGAQDAQGASDRITLLQALDPTSPVSLRLQLVRRGGHPDSAYEVDLVGVV